MQRKRIDSIIELMHTNASDRQAVITAHGIGLCTFEEMKKELERLDLILQTLTAERDRETQGAEVEVDYFGLFCEVPWTDLSLRKS